MNRSFRHRFGALAAGVVLAGSLSLGAIAPAGAAISAGNSVTTAQLAQAGTVETENAKIVTALYLAFLDRQPSAAELQAGRAALGPNRDVMALVRTLSTSDEWLEVFVKDLYDQALERSPDADGLRYWVGQMKDRKPSTYIAASVFASAEFRAKAGGSDAGFVDRLYHRVLQRSNDASGKQYWLGLLASSSDEAIAVEFFESQENRNRRVTLQYEQLLCRTPDSAGRAYWAGVITGGRDILLSEQLATSPEFIQNAINGRCVMAAAPGGAQPGDTDPGDDTNPGGDNPGPGDDNNPGDPGDDTPDNPGGDNPGGDNPGPGDDTNPGDPGDDNPGDPGGDNPGDNPGGGPTPDFQGCATIVPPMSKADCEILVEIYHALDGPNWTQNHAGWLDGNNPCTWQGITCQGAVIRQLELRSVGAAGVIPASLGDLTGLLLLRISGDSRITGFAPTIDFSGMGLLVRIYFNGTGITDLPDLNVVKHLRDLDVSNTNIGDNIAKVTTHQNIHWLFANNAGITTFNAAGMPNLDRLHLADNRLTTVPDGLRGGRHIWQGGNFWQQPGGLELQGNRIALVPAWIKDLDQLPEVFNPNGPFRFGPQCVASVTVENDDPAAIAFMEQRFGPNWNATANC